MKSSEDPKKFKPKTKRNKRKAFFWNPHVLDYIFSFPSGFSLIVQRPFRTKSNIYLQSGILTENSAREFSEIVLCKVRRYKFLTSGAQFVCLPSFFTEAFLFHQGKTSF
jgi:hypothetical protein